MLLAEVRLNKALPKPVSSRLFVEVGQWDLIIDPVEFNEVVPGKFTALVGYFAPDAPHDTLIPGARLELRRGGRVIGTAVVLGL